VKMNAVITKRDEIQSGSESNRIIQMVQDQCDHLGKTALKGKPTHPDKLSKLALWIYRMINSDCSAPPALERAILTSESYLSREQMLMHDSKPVVSGIFSFIHLLIKAAAQEKKDNAKAVRETWQILEEAANKDNPDQDAMEHLKLGRDPRLLIMLRELDSHDSVNSALNQKQLSEKLGIKSSPQISAYLKNNGKYNLWYVLPDGRAKRYFITEKGRRVLRTMQEGTVPVKHESINPGIYPSAEQTERRKKQVEFILLLCKEYAPELLRTSYGNLIWNPEWDKLGVLLSEKIRRKKETEGITGQKEIRKMFLELLTNEFSVKMRDRMSTFYYDRDPYNIVMNENIDFTETRTPFIGVETLAD